jgi:uncharacterized protein (DUF302 family)
MNDFGRRIVVDLGFDAVLEELSRAIREEGLQTIARIDVRDHFWRDIAHDFRQYFVIEAWSPELALDALRLNLDVGAILPTAFAVYELADGETAVVATETFSSLAANPAWRQDSPGLAAIADREDERIARVLDRMQHRPLQHASISPAA